MGFVKTQLLHSVAMHITQKSFLRDMEDGLKIRVDSLVFVLLKILIIHARFHLVTISISFHLP